MKKIGKILSLALLVIFFGTMDVNAMTLQPTGDKTGIRGKDINLYVTLNKTESEKSISAVEGMFSFDDSVFTLGSVSNLIGNEWIEFSPVTNNGTFSYANITFNKIITNNSTNILKIILKVKDNAKYGDTTISIKNATGTDDTGDGVSIQNGNHNVKILSDENNLSSLNISEANINFNQDTVNYNLEIDNEKVTINAEKKDSNSKMTGDIGEKNLKYGLNTFKITVTSESGINKVYTLNITRPDKRSNVNSLSELKLSQGTIKFKSETLNYNIEVENDISTIDIEAVLKDEKSSFVAGFGNRKVDLKEGKNVYLIKVQAENESIRTYTLNITRKSNKSSNNYLKELKLSNGNINFDAYTTNYNVAVLYEIENIQIEAITEDSKAKYEIVGNTNLIVGENVITIKVTAEDESVKEYKIIITRKDATHIPSSNSKLSSLTIEGYELNFDSNKHEYSLKINDETKLSIKYVLEDESSTVKIAGNNNLKNGSVISITSIAEDGSETIYKINIGVDANNTFIIYIIVSIAIILIVLIIIFTLTKKKKNNKSNNDNNESFSKNNLNDDATNKQQNDNVSVNENTTTTNSVEDTTLNSLESNPNNVSNGVILNQTLDNNNNNEIFPKVELNVDIINNQQNDNVSVSENITTTNSFEDTNLNSLESNPNNVSNGVILNQTLDNNNNNEIFPNIFSNGDLKNNEIFNNSNNNIDANEKTNLNSIVEKIDISELNLFGPNEDNNK